MHDELNGKPFPDDGGGEIRKTFLLRFQQNLSECYQREHCTHLGNGYMFIDPSNQYGGTYVRI